MCDVWCVMCEGALFIGAFMCTFLMVSFEQCFRVMYVYFCVYNDHKVIGRRVHCCCHYRMMSSFIQELFTMKIFVPAMNFVAKPVSIQ